MAYQLKDLEAVVAKWLQDGRCPPSAIGIKAKFEADLDTRLTIQTCQGLLLANLHHIKTNTYVHRVNSASTS